MEIKDRIEHIIKVKNLTATQFAEEINIQRSGISHILSGRNNPSMDFILKVKEKYPEYSLDWLLLGKGPITISPPKSAKAVQPSLFETDEVPIIENEEIKVEEVVKSFSSEMKEQKNVSTEQYDLKRDHFVENKNTSHQIDERHSGNQKKVVRMILIYDNRTFDVLESNEI
jgi:transcriptional regulator with XRE-family HTH domain